MKEKLPKVLIGIVFSFLQKRPGPISRDALALASSCHTFWRGATTHVDLHASTRTFYTVIIDYDTDSAHPDSIYSKPQTAFCFDGISECWKRTPFSAFLSYEQCLAEIQKINKPKKYLIFEVRLARADLMEIPGQSGYQVDPDAMVGMAIQKVCVIYSPSRPRFLTAENGILPMVDRTQIHKPNDFDNPAYAKPLKSLRDLRIFSAEAPELDIFKDLVQVDPTSLHPEHEKHCNVL